MPGQGQAPGEGTEPLPPPGHGKREEGGLAVQGLPASPAPPAGPPAGLPPGGSTMARRLSGRAGLEEGGVQPGAPAWEPSCGATSEGRPVSCPSPSRLSPATGAPGLGLPTFPIFPKKPEIGACV